ncbi:MAG: Sec-independent protein translocase subunit TatA [Succinivibrio sp.]|jgi:sec-independent protein translocase protein TatA|nr:Sec-independent protein translocase subunit TatA [Succinivibrio sp.]
MGAFSVWHWLILLAVIALIFGTGRLKNLGKDLGGAIKGFKEGINAEDAAQNAAPQALPADKQKEH